LRLQTRRRDLAAGYARALLEISLPSEIRGRRESRVRAAPAVSRASLHIRKRTRAYRFSGGNPAFPARWFTAYFVLSPVSRALLPPSSAEACFCEFSASVGRRDHTTSPSASVPFVKGTSASTASHRAFRDDREPPLLSGETGEFVELICPTG
jgi:hypothetical protein